MADDRRAAVRDRRRPARDRRLTAAAADPRRAIIENVRPQIDAGRFAVKRTPGETVHVAADVFADGHDVLAVVLLDRPVTTTTSAEPARRAEADDRGFGSASRGDSRSNANDHSRAVKAEQLETTDAPDESASPATSVLNLDGWRETEMTLVAPGTDEWTGSFTVESVGSHQYAIVAWVDRFRSWLHGFEIKARAGQDVAVELLEGSLLVREAASRADEHGAAADAAWLLSRADALTDDTLPLEDRVSAASGPALVALMFTYADRSHARQSGPLRVWVDRERARFGSWYEFFPRSTGPDSNRSGTFVEAMSLLPRIADLGFDVVYLPPIHPIGTSFRKGRNNTLLAAPGDPGSPWAIGSDAGGHTAVDPGLGTIDDFIEFRRAAERLGLEVALDLAWQCSPDHPWVTEHPEWFRRRPDGTIKYAENPPKKYQDIYPLDLECDEWRSLWRALLDVTLFWIVNGVRIFRVDNPHTKPFGFWEWLIAEVHAQYPDVIFLAEAFTRPKLMRYLAKAGFTQSYTYFTWRTTKDELTEYLQELTGTAIAQYLRPNFFANTPDILHAYLQHGGRPAFEARLLLAATLSASYGIYSGFELCEARAAGPASEEYADSEKYQYRKWDWDRPGNISELVARLNRARRQHRALQFNDTLRFHPTNNPAIIAYSKTVPDHPAGPDASRERVLTIVNLDPHHMQHGWVDAQIADDDSIHTVTDLLDDVTYRWRGRWNYVRLDPGVRQGHLMLLDGTV